MVTRVGDYASQQILRDRMMATQSRIYDSSLQVNTKQKSQDYVGLFQDSFRLVNLETMNSRMERFKSDNVAAETRIKTMGSAITKTDKVARDLLTKVMDFSQYRSTEMTQEYLASVASTQQIAVQTMTNVQYFLNTEIDGRFLFAGGRTNSEPVSLLAGDMAGFQNIYDGRIVTAPETRAANLFNVDFRDVGVTFSNPATPTIGGKNVGAIDSGVASQFITGTVTGAGSVTWATTVPDPDPLVPAGEGSITSSNANAFSGLTQGMTLLIDSGIAGQDGVYTVTEVSEDGRSIKITPPPPAGGADAAASINIGVPDGATIKIESSTGNDAYYSVRWPANGAIPAGDMPNILSGQKLYVEPPFATTGAQTHVNVLSTGYYNGDTLALEHRVDETRTVTVGTNAQDPAFEKALRAMAILGQGMPKDGAGNIDTVEWYRRVDKAKMLLGDAVQHSVNNREGSSDLQRVSQQLGLTQKVVADAQTEQTNQMAFFEDRIAGIEQVDSATAIAQLNSDYTTLQASYQVSARLSKLSLANYI